MVASPTSYSRARSAMVSPRTSRRSFDRRLPVYSDKRTFSKSVGMSQECRHRKSGDFSITSSVHSSWHFGLDGLRQKRSRAVAQDLGQQVRKSSWLGELENDSVGLGVSLLQWRSGGFEHPHDTPPYPLMPSPTFVHSSSLVGGLTNEASHGASGPFIANTPVDDSPVRHCSSVRSNRNRVGFLPAAIFRGQVDAVPVAVAATVWYRIGVEDS
jgi:hypothetical protein